MKTKNIFKALAVAMLMPAMLLTTACSSEDDFVNNNENNIKQGYTLPVTINVTREGDATTRATYNESTGKLTFSAGDKLFVSGNETTAGKFAGTLTWQSGGTFSGTLTTQNEFTGTADALFTDANSVSAILLPAGYNNYDFLTLKTNNGYDATISTDHSKTFALTKAAAVEQFSLERTFSYSNGFSLYPSCGILNFTITGLTPNTDVNVNFSDYTPNGNTMVGTVHTDGSGNATFAVAVYAYSSKNIQTCSLYVNGNPIALVNSSKPIDAGKIYNIARSATGALINLAEVSANKVAQNGDILTGTLAHNVRISIADGATVILNGVSINATGEWTSGNYAGITCEGDATIILSGTNTVKGFYQNFPGIEAAAGKTLTINGTGSLTASSYGYGAGIGGGDGIACGNIEIQGGTITATGGDRGAGIGGGNDTSCGNITISGGTVTATGGWRAAGIGSGRTYDYGSCGDILISGGTVTATGGDDAAGIGGGRGYNSGYLSSCGTITITTGVTKVTATKGDGAPNSIGAGNLGTCGTVKFGNQTMYNGSIWTTTPTSGNTYGGFSLTISQTVYEADTWTLTPVLP